MFKTSLTENELICYSIRQLDHFFPDEHRVAKESMLKATKSAFEKIEYCFKYVNCRYFFDGEKIIFNHLNADHYAMFLYILSNTLYKNEADLKTCDKIFLLNRMCHGIDAFYKVELPSIFLFTHPVGAVLGRAKYSDYFLVTQHCTAGSNKDVFPEFGKWVSMHPGSAVIGNCKIGDNCKISVGSTMLDQNLESNHIYIGSTTQHICKQSNTRLSIWKTENIT